MKDILDKKSVKEIRIHQINYYQKFLFNRKSLSNIKMFNFSKINNDTIFKVNIHKISGYEGHYYFSGSNPLVKTAQQILNNSNLKLNDSYLFKYYQQFQPKTYGELYHLKKENKLHQIESTNIFHPWFHSKPTNQFNCGLFGPKDNSNVLHRMLRIKNIITNISKFGYKPTPNDMIEGYILLKKNDYRFVITAGHHRVAVLTAIFMKDNSKFNNLIVKYDITRIKIKIVRECGVNEWPGVLSGYLNRKDALEIFHSYFS